MYLGTRFTDCSISNIKINSPRAGNVNPSYGIYLSNNGNHHNKYDNLDINIGADLIDTPSGTSDTCGLYITQGNSITNAKNYLSNSKIKSSRVAIHASCLDVSNTEITGSAYIAGDSVEFTKVEVNKNAFKFTSQQPVVRFKVDEYPSYYVPSNNVMKINELVNNSGINQNIEYNNGLVSVECASGGIAIPLTGLSDCFSGKIYLNNYPQIGYWLAQNYWHKMEASAVQYVTSDNISGGFSIDKHSWYNISSTSTIISHFTRAIPWRYGIYISIIAWQPHSNIVCCNEVCYYIDIKGYLG
jgi:hypothetical protein